MKIAITADFHLKADGASKGRLKALRNIIDQMILDEVSHLIIAGDLFDIKSHNYSIFDDICKEKDYRDISFYIISGNHDPGLKQNQFSAKNIMVFEKPTLMKIAEFKAPFFFIPYENRSMGQVLAESKLPDDWMLVAHGDYLPGIRQPNLYEAGIYMPLSRSDIEYYRPGKVFLGHIHKGMQLGKVFYPGSPCPMDINETGRRRFLLLDSLNMEVITRTVDTEEIFFNETLRAIPLSDEFGYIRETAQKMIKGWALEDLELKKARLRIKVRGYTSDKKRLAEVLEEVFFRFDFIDGNGPDLSEVLLFDDPERIRIVERIKEEIDSLEHEQEFKEDIMEKALEIILEA
jgi:DNA repair protein SbcD/Mre11